MKKVLIANRGEIAVRIARTLREMGIASVAVYSEADRDAPHVRLADFACAIGPAPAAQSYLDVERILNAAERSGADGVHPGYGFLSENAEFARACESRGLTFIGPSADAIAQMGSKTEARARMQAAGVPIVPGGSASSTQDAQRTAEALGFPVLIKASAGGGGKGMRLVSSAQEIPAAFERAQSEAQRAFGDPTVYIEKALLQPRHVEIQVLADRQGNTVHLFERDCSIQRRHQKVIEETPCPALAPETLARMAEVSVNGARAIGYYSAGTFEFLLDQSGQFYFLEMNTRLQVEHPITELVTGLDLVREMIRIARGEPLGFAQQDIARRGAALQCRVYAEDPLKGFLPSPGLVETLRVPSGPSVRDDSGIAQGYRVTPYYDPLLSKLCVWAPTREQAISRMSRALAEYRVLGLATNLSFHRKVMLEPDFVAGHYDTGYIEAHKATLCSPDTLSDGDAHDVALALAAIQANQDVAAGRERAARASSPAANALPAWVRAERQGG